MSVPDRSRAAEVVGLAALTLALSCATAGGGGLATVPGLAFHLLTLLAASAMVVGGRHRATPVVGAATLLVAVVLAGAPGGAYPFATLVQGTHLGAALLLAWAAARLAEGRGPLVDASLAVAAGVGLVLQLAGEVGLVAGGRLDVAPGPRPLGTFTDANHLATFLLVVAAVSLPRAGRTGAVARAHLVLTALAGAFVLLTGSRAAPAGLALLGLAEFSRRHGRGSQAPLRVRVAVGACAALLLLAAAIVTVSRRQDSDGWVRGRIWAAVAPAALERPLLGLGAGTFAHVHQAYDFARPRGLTLHGKRVTSPHGEWLRLPVETGLLGTLAALVLVAALVGSRRAGADRRGLMGPAVAVLPMLLLNDVLRAPAVLSWLAVALALAPRGVRGADASEVAQASPRPLRPWTLLALAVGAGVAVAGAVVLPALADLSAADPPGVARSLRLNPWHPRTWARVASLAASEGRPLTPRAAAVAEAALAEATRVAPRDPALARGLARLAARAARDLGDPGGTTTRLARARFERAAALDPFDVFVRLEAAEALLGRGDADGAARFATAAAAVEPACVAALALQVLAARASGDEPAAATARAELVKALDAAAARTPETPYERQVLAVNPRLVEQALGRAAP